MAWWVRPARFATPTHRFVFVFAAPFGKSQSGTIGNHPALLPKGTTHPAHISCRTLRRVLGKAAHVESTSHGGRHNANGIRVPCRPLRLHERPRQHARRTVPPTPQPQSGLTWARSARPPDRSGLTRKALRQTCRRCTLHLRRPVKSARADWHCYACGYARVGPRAGEGGPASPLPHASRTKSCFVNLLAKSRTIWYRPSPC